MPFIVGSELLHWVADVLIIDTIATGTGYLVSWLANIFRRVQTGVLNTYAFAILSGAVVLLLYFFWGRSV